MLIFFLTHTLYLSYLGDANKFTASAGRKSAFLFVPTKNNWPMVTDVETPVNNPVDLLAHLRAFRFFGGAIMQFLRKLKSLPPVKQQNHNSISQLIRVADKLKFLQTSLVNIFNDQVGEDEASGINEIFSDIDDQVKEIIKAWEGANV